MSWYLAHWHFPTGTEKENKTCDSARCCIINLLKSKFESLRAKERSRPRASWVLGSSSCCPEHDGDNKARSGSWKILSKLSLRRNSQLLFTEPGNYPFGIMPSCEVVKLLHTFYSWRNRLGEEAGGVQGPTGNRELNRVCQTTCPWLYGPPLWPTPG